MTSLKYWEKKKCYTLEFYIQGKLVSFKSEDKISIFLGKKKAEVQYKKC